MRRASSPPPSALRRTRMRSSMSSPRLVRRLSHARPFAPRPFCQYAPCSFRQSQTSLPTRSPRIRAPLRLAHLPLACPSRRAYACIPPAHTDPPCFPVPPDLRAGLASCRSAIIIRGEDMLNPCSASPDVHCTYRLNHRTHTQPAFNHAVFSSLMHTTYTILSARRRCRVRRARSVHALYDAIPGDGRPRCSSPGLP